MVHLHIPLLPLEECLAESSDFGQAGLSLVQSSLQRKNLKWNIIKTCMPYPPSVLIFLGQSRNYKNHPGFLFDPGMSLFSPYLNFSAASLCMCLGHQFVDREPWCVRIFSRAKHSWFHIKASAGILQNIWQWALWRTWVGLILQCMKIRSLVSDRYQ